MPNDPRSRSRATTGATRPIASLRPLDAFFVHDSTHGRLLVLRDGEGIAPSQIVLPAELAVIVARFDGARTPSQIAAEASRATGRVIEARLVADLADELDAACMLDSPRFHARRREVVHAFASTSVRTAFHAGGAYHGDATRLSAFIDDECLAKAPPPNANGTLVGLTAPHMDLWRAAVGYGHAYRAFGDAVPPDADTFVLLGTSHAPMRRPFAVCDKSFDTPLGAIPADHEAIRELAGAARFDLREDEYLHRGEHSLEFQAVFIRHAIRDRDIRIVPVLCGLGAAIRTGEDPSLDADAESFLAGLRRLVERRAGRVVLVAGADLAHVGPRFGDRDPLDARGRDALAQRDGASIDRALDRDAPGFFLHVFEDLDARRVCGLGPIYTLLRALPASRGVRLHYAQNVDPGEGSIVSHTSLGFYS